MNLPDHIHKVGDGRGFDRRFFVDGREITGVIYADTKKGVLRHYDYPLKIHKHRKRAISRTVRGKVEVKNRDA